MQTVILCGGRGMRLREYTEAIPKVLVEVGGRPILWHIMKGYAHHSYTDFVLALGYLGGRLKRVRSYLQDDVFFATYGDGVSDIDLRRLEEFHRSHGRIATVTIVKPRLTFRLFDVDGEQQVTRFTEKPALAGWITGG